MLNLAFITRISWSVLGWLHPICKSWRLAVYARNFPISKPSLYPHPSLYSFSQPWTCRGSNPEHCTANNFFDFFYRVCTCLLSQTKPRFARVIITRRNVRSKTAHPLVDNESMADSVTYRLAPAPTGMPSPNVSSASPSLSMSSIYIKWWGSSIST